MAAGQLLETLGVTRRGDDLPGLAPAGREHAGDQRLASFAGAENRKSALGFHHGLETLPRRERRYIAASAETLLSIDWSTR